MPVELRKRKAPAAAPAPPAKKVAAPKTATKKAAPKAAPNSAAKRAAPKAAGAAASGKVSVGDVIDLDTFGGEVETNDGVKTSLKALVDESKAGVVLFTYPKASTPGCKFKYPRLPTQIDSLLYVTSYYERTSCVVSMLMDVGTTQVCLFRDSYEPLTAGGLAIYGLSADSPKANTTFKTKQKLPYPLLCDQAATLIEAIGLKKSPKGTQRGVFVVDKKGKVLVAEPGGPAATAERVKKLVDEM